MYLNIHESAIFLADSHFNKKNQHFLQFLQKVKNKQIKDFQMNTLNIDTYMKMDEKQLIGEKNRLSANSKLAEQHTEERTLLHKKAVIALIDVALYEKSREKRLA